MIGTRFPCTAMAYVTMKEAGKEREEANER